MQQERRKFKRVVLNTVVRWQKYLNASEHTPNYPALARNISSGGLCFMTYGRVNVDDRLKIDVITPGGKTIKMVGQVVWIRDVPTKDNPPKERFEVGVKLLQITPEDKAVIDKLTFFSFVGRK
jgi:hypothetical protein